MIPVYSLYSLTRGSLELSSSRSGVRVGALVVCCNFDICQVPPIKMMSAFTKLSWGQENSIPNLTSKEYWE